jgi:small-conductance mechanosensitive channel
VQKILGDLFASLSIMLDQPPRHGDFIVVDTMSGTVEHIGLKTTRIRSISGEQIIVSNTDLLKSRIRNYKRMQERRVVFTVGVEYHTPAEKLERVPALIREIVSSREHVRFDRAHFQTFGESACCSRLSILIDPDDARYMDTQAINRHCSAAVYKIFFSHAHSLLRQRGIQHRIWVSDVQRVAVRCVSQGG